MSDRSQRQPTQQPPPVQWLRVRYAKRGRLRFTSHRDFSRAFERALVRAGLPVAYSSGFHPHPRISYAGAAPTGAASEAEYLELGLAAAVDPGRALAVLDDALPDGLDVVAVAAVETRSGEALADLLAASRWRIRLPGVDAARADDAVRGFLDHAAVNVQRMTKKGLRSFDARAAVVSLEAHGSPDSEQPCAILEMVLRHGDPSVRPDDVLAGLRATAGLEAADPVFQRLAQGPLDVRAGTVGDPLTLNRDAV